MMGQPEGNDGSAGQRRPRGRWALFGVVLAILAIAGVQINNRLRVRAAVRGWQRELGAAHLIGQSKGAVLAYLSARGMDYQEDILYDVSIAVPLPRRAIGELGVGAARSEVATTWSPEIAPVPVHWRVEPQFAFDKRGRLLWYHVEAVPVK